MSASKIPKPYLRGLVKDYIIKASIVSGCLSLFAGWSIKHWVADPRKKAYREFYKDYNAEAEADRLYKMGLIRGWNDNEDVPEQKLQMPF